MDPRSPARSDNLDADPSSPAWQKYYADASRRRRTNRKQFGRLQDERKRRRTREMVLIIGSMVFLGGMTLIFHSLLSR
jgi:hypothetical protein